jgi:EspG family
MAPPLSRFEAVEVTAEQAWFLADHLPAGTYPWKLAITAPYFDLADRDGFNQRCLEELTAAQVIDEQGRVRPAVAQCVRAVCHPRQWLEWLTVVDKDQILRAVLARTSSPLDVVVALRYAQMVTFTPMQVGCSEEVVPIITAGLPDQSPARFDEFSLPLDITTTIDERIAHGADIVETLTELGVPEETAQVMEIARTGEHTNVEITAHDAINGASHATDVCINIISTEVGRILVCPSTDAGGGAGESVFAPADPFAVAVAVHDLTARLPSGTWFPDETFTI